MKSYRQIFLNIPVHDGRDKEVALEIGHQCYLGTESQTSPQAWPATSGRGRASGERDPGGAVFGQDKAYLVKRNSIPFLLFGSV